jgi:hypothetical protein
VRNLPSLHRETLVVCRRILETACSAAEFWKLPVLPQGLEMFLYSPRKFIHSVCLLDKLYILEKKYAVPPEKSSSRGPEKSSFRGPEKSSFRVQKNRLFRVQKKVYFTDNFFDKILLTYTFLFINFLYTIPRCCFFITSPRPSPVPRVLEVFFNDHKKVQKGPFFKKCVFFEKSQKRENRPKVG